MDEEWDGNERRAVMLADERSRPNGKTVEVPIVAVIVGFAAVLLLELTSVVHHFLLERAHEAEAKVDASFVCYVVKTSQGQPASVDLLTDCGFIPRIKGVTE